MDNNPPPRKRGLGRGLAALIRNTEYEESAQTDTQPTAASSKLGIQQIAIERIHPNPHQPRTQFEPALLAELADSVKVHGILQPLIVTESVEQPGHYTLIAGERRWRAAQLADLSTVPALVREASPSQVIEWALIENVQRADLNALEEAAAYQALMDEFGLTQDEVAERVGKSRPAIGNALRLLRLPAWLQEAVISSQISAGHARALLSLQTEDQMQQAFNLVVQQGLSVRQTEALVKKLQSAAEQQAETTPEPEPALIPQLAHLENRFRAALGTRVNLNRNANGSGRLVIHFYNDEDLTQLYHLITGDNDAD
jgi:ParB family chromosome partitioning protein